MVLSDSWARARHGAVIALIVDHGLRRASAAEAAITRQRLGRLGIPARVLTLSGLRDSRPPGAPVAAAARAARYRALTDASREVGILHLLLGHHAADQAETRLIRVWAGSGPTGLAGMAAVRETPHVRLLRPLLDVPPAGLRAYLQARGIAWLEDPSNRDPRALRTQARAALHPIETGAGQGAARARQDTAMAAELAGRATISPLGYALLTPGPIGPAALASLWQAISGRPYPPPGRAIAALAAAPGPATMAGARLIAAGKLGPGWLLLRDQPAPPPVPASHGAVWDRFRLQAPSLPRGHTMGAAGGAAPPGALPAAIRRLLPAVFHHGQLAAIPQLDLGDPRIAFHFTPAVPAVGAPFVLPFRDA